MRKTNRWWKPMASRQRQLDLFGNSIIVIPAEAGIQTNNVHLHYWIPAFAGMTPVFGLDHCPFSGETGIIPMDVHFFQMPQPCPIESSFSYAYFVL